MIKAELIAFLRDNGWEKITEDTPYSCLEYRKDNIVIDFDENEIILKIGDLFIGADIKGIDARYHHINLNGASVAIADTANIYCYYCGKKMRKEEGVITNKLNLHLSDSSLKPIIRYAHYECANKAKENLDEAISKIFD